MGLPKNLEAIKECLRKSVLLLHINLQPILSLSLSEFKGEPDPLRGDQIYSRVRDAARETLEAVFDSQQPVTTSAVAAATRIQGMGHDYVPTEKEKKTFLSSMASSIKSA